MCQVLLSGWECVFAPTLEHFLDRQKTIEIWFQGVMEPHIHQVQTSPSFFFSPSDFCFEVRRGNRNCERATCQDQNHTTQQCCCPADSSQPWGCARGQCQELDRLEGKDAWLGSKPSTAFLRPCLSFLLCHIEIITIHSYRSAWKDTTHPSSHCSWDNLQRCELPLLPSSPFSSPCSSSF